MRKKAKLSRALPSAFEVQSDRFLSLSFEETSVHAPPTHPQKYIVLLQDQIINTDLAF
jgi:hypothetical protein